MKEPKLPPYACCSRLIGARIDPPVYMLLRVEPRVQEQRQSSAVPMRHLGRDRMCMGCIDTFRSLIDHDNPLSVDDERILVFWESGGEPIPWQPVLAVELRANVVEESP